MSAAQFSSDVLEFLALLRQHRVRYLVVGGEAVSQYGYASITGDMDIFYDPDAGNAVRLFRALRQFWGGTIPGVGDAHVLRRRGTVIQFGRPPNRLDLVNRIDGVSFAA